MIERVVVFGRENCMTGVVTEPGMDGGDAERPAILLLTAGIVHHVGPFRLYVDLARRLAADGFLVLRFDVTGVGDSQMRPENLPEGEVPLVDIREAMDFVVRRYRCCKFVLLGLCSGAYQAHEVAVRDSRVVGTVMLDGYGYRTMGYYLRHYWAKYSSVRRIVNFLRRKRCEQRTGSWSMRPEDPRLEIYAENFPPQDRVADEIRELAARGIRMLFLYSGGVPEYFNSRRQFAEMFGKHPADRVEVEYLERADHTYSWTQDREILIKRVSCWLNRGFAPSGPQPIEDRLQLSRLAENVVETNHHS